MKKKILISVYDMEIGGIERSLINMLESFDYDHYEVDLLIFHHRGDLLPFIPKRVRILPELSKCTVLRKPVSQCLKEGHLITSLVRIVCKGVAHRMAMKRKLKEGSAYIQMQLSSKYCTHFMPRIQKEYDLAISYAWPHDLIAAKVKCKRKIAWIHTDYSQLEVDRQLDYSVWEKFDYIASISEACTQSFLDQYPTLEDRIILIENITSPDFIRKMADDSTVPDRNKDDFQILSVGRLSFAKGFDLAIQALKLLHDRGLGQIKWYVIGYGGYEASLRELIDQYQLQDSFILLGKKVNPYPYMRACDLYVQPSRYEGKAVTVTEAKILGKPILLTDYPTARSQLEEGIEGLICDLSVEGIATGIETMYKREELRKELEENLKMKSFNNSSELEKLYAIL